MISVSDAFDPLKLALESAGIRYAVGGSSFETSNGEYVVR